MAVDPVNVATCSASTHKFENSLQPDIEKPFLVTHIPFHKSQLYQSINP